MCFQSFTSDLLLGAVHLAGAHRGVSVGADVLLQASTHRQVVGVLVALDGEDSALQGAQVELVATPGVSNPTAVTCQHNQCHTLNIHDGVGTIIQWLQVFIIWSHILFNSHSLSPMLFSDSWCISITVFHKIKLIFMKYL